MVTITADQARKRFQTLPPSIQDAMFSSQTAEIIDRIAEDNSLDDSRASILATVVGWTLLGFVHAEDIASELQNDASMPSQTAVTVANAVNVKILVPLKSDLEKTYAPAPYEHETTQGPKIIQDIGPRFAPSAPSPSSSASAPKVISQTIGGASGPLMSMTPLAGNQSKAAPPPAAPTAPKAPLEAPGWSRSSAAEPVVKLNQTSTPPPENVAPRVAPAAQRPAAPAVTGPIGEFERMTLQGGKGGTSAPQQAPAPKAPTSPAPSSNMPAPMIIHEDAAFKPASQPPNFHLQLPAQLSDPMKSGGPAASPVRPAMLELGKSAPPQTPSPKTTTRVVHYTEYKSPSPEAPVMGASVPPSSPGPRQVTELTAAAPPPPPPPPARPSPAPQAPRPAPQAPTPNKVVFKNYGPESSPPSSPPKNQNPLP